MLNVFFAVVDDDFSRLEEPVVVYLFVLKIVLICFRVQILGIIFSREGDAALAVSAKVVNHRHLK
jgi:hypothetical protein